MRSGLIEKKIQKNAEQTSKISIEKVASRTQLVYALILIEAHHSNEDNYQISELS